MSLAPRAYFRRMLEAVGSSTESRKRPAPPAAPARPVGQPPVYRRGEPALRLFKSGLARPWPDNVLVAGARVTLSGVADGASEKLLYDLGLSRIAVEATPGPRADELTLRFGRRDLAGAYLAALASLRYINWSARPTAGDRRVVVEAIDIEGGVHRIGDLRFEVASAFAPPERPVAARGPESSAEIVRLAPPRAAPPVGAAVAPASPAPAAAAAPMPAAPAAVFVSPPIGAATTPPRAGGSNALFSGGRAYRIFGAPPDARPPAATAAPPTANDPARPPALAAGPLATPIDMVWTPESGRLPPRLDEVRPILTLDDLFGSEHGGDAMLSALTRRERPRPPA